MVVFVVHRRIGGLESNGYMTLPKPTVHRRIGGLERIGRNNGQALAVHRRIGGLEMEPSYPH